MKLGSWLGAAALIPLLAIGCPGDDDDDSDPNPSSDAGSSKDASTATSDSGAPNAGSGVANAGSGGAVVDDRSCNWQSEGGELASAFFRIGSTTCRLCSENDRDRSNCLDAPVSETAINCIRARVCSDEVLKPLALHMVGCLDSRNGLCNAGAEESCTNGCLEHSAGDAHKWCGSDPTMGAAMAKCGIELTTSGGGS